MLTADKVLVTIGTPCSVSAVGATETYLARVTGAPEFIAFAAFDAGLIDIDAASDGSLQLRWTNGEPATLADIEQRHGQRLRSNLGIRYFDELTSASGGVVTDIAAALPHDFESGGLRRLAGLTYRDVRDSVLKDMYGLFDDDPRVGPSLQAQLFAYAGLGALAALPAPLSELLTNPYDFRVAGGTAFQGMDSLAELRAAGSPEVENDKLRDKFALRLASSLSTHGPALLSTMLAPSYSLSKSLKNPALLDSLRSASGYMRVPQSPLNASGACASSSIVFCEFAPQMVLDYPGFHKPIMALWTAADAATRPRWQILDAFGPGALMTRSKLDTLNASRSPADQRHVVRLPGAVRHRRERHRRRRRRLGPRHHDARLRAAQLPRHHVDHHGLGSERRSWRQGAFRRRRFRRRERAHSCARAFLSRSRLWRCRLSVPGRPCDRHAHQLKDRSRHRFECARRRGAAAGSHGRLATHARRDAESRRRWAHDG